MTNCNKNRMKEFLKELTIFVGFSVLVVIVLFSVIIPTIYFSEKFECNNYSDVTKRETVYKYFGGCFVQTESEWLTRDEYEKVIVARYGLKEAGDR